MATLYNSKHRSWTTLNNGGSLSNSAVSVTVLSAASLPAAPFVATIEPGVTGQEEVVAVTGVASNTLTIVRGLDGTTGVSHPDGCLFKNLSSSLAWADLISLFANHKHTGSDSTLVLPNYYALNAVPNGGFEVWQRPFTTGTQFTSPVNNTITADRWYWNGSGTGVVNVLQDTSLPAVSSNMPASLYSGKVNVTTADTSLASNDIYSYYTSIEGYDIRALANGFAASWWAKAHRTGIYCISFVNRALNRSYVVEYTITVADTWQYFTTVVPAPPGTWTYDNTIGMYCFFPLASGSLYTVGTNNTWTSNFAYATTNQVNGVGATTDTFSVWGLNVVPGGIPQPYQPMSFQLQLERLKRYYQPIVNITFGPVGHGHCLSTTRFFITRPIDEMGGIPTISFSAVGDFSCYNQGTAIVVTSIADFATSVRMLWLDCSVAAGLTAGDGTMMYGNNSSARLAVAWNPA
jgi:hypothetical protein